MLWEIQITPAEGEPDFASAEVLSDADALGISGLHSVRTSRGYLVEGRLDRTALETVVAPLLVDPVSERWQLRDITAEVDANTDELNVLLKPGVTDNVAKSALETLRRQVEGIDAVATLRKYEIEGEPDSVERFASKVLVNDAIEVLHRGPLSLRTIGLGGAYQFEKVVVPVRTMDDDALVTLSREGLLSLSLEEMKTVQAYFAEKDRDPTDIELETIAQTWSEHCSHKTLAGRIEYRDEQEPERSRRFENMLKETVFAATMTVKEQLGAGDWTVSVFKDNAGVVTFTDTHDVCIKVETHNHPSALEPYGGANTGLGGVIRDPLGTGLGAKPVCNTDVFCFAPPDTPGEDLPPGVLHPKAVLHGVVAGVRDYGNRMGIPTVNGAVYFDERYLGNPLVYCGNVAVLPVGMSEGAAKPGDLIVAVGGRTGRDGIHGATFSSVELTEDSEETSGGAVQIGNAVEEKKVADAILTARDEGLYNAITDCGAGGFSSAVGEMGEETGAEVWLDKCPLKYEGLSYDEIWISEAQERMVLSVPEANWDRFREICEDEATEATLIGRFTDDRLLVLNYGDHEVGRLDMAFLHNGRPPVVREAVWRARNEELEAGSEGAASDTNPLPLSAADVLKRILASPNVRSKEWIIRQYDHEVQGGSVVKPLVGVTNDGPSDAAVVRPLLDSQRGLVISCGMNPHLGDPAAGGDPYWMAIAAIDEALRNAVCVGADPAKVAILDNFCWGNTEKPEVLGSLVRAAIGCQDAAVAFGTPFVSGKDSLYNEFSYVDADGQKQTVAIPASLLITALGQIDDVRQSVTMDLKRADSTLLSIGRTDAAELGGSHFNLVTGRSSGRVPRVDLETAPKVLAGLHAAIRTGHVRACHDCSEGGLAVTLAEMAFAGGLGIEVTRPHSLDELFSESCTRFVIEVDTESVDEVTAAFDAHLGSSGAAEGLIRPIGRVVQDPVVRITGPEEDWLIESPNAELKAAWQTPLV